MKNSFRKLTHSMMAISLASFFTLAAVETIQAAPVQPANICAEGFTLSQDKCVMNVGYSTSGQELTIPKGLGPVDVVVIGGGGGTGGTDCGVGCTPALGGPAGVLALQFSDLSGKKLNLYPGQRGKDGITAGSGGGGSGGVSSYSASYNGGRGGHAGPVGTSGTGGGGGAASVLVIDGKEYIAGGAGGGGGSANSPSGSKPGVADGKIATSALAVNVFENNQATYTAPQNYVFVSSQLRYESTNNPSCGFAIEPNVVGQRQFTIIASNNIWGDACFGTGKRVTGFLYYATGSVGGAGTDSSCSYFCDGAGGGGGGGGISGGAGGGLYQAPNGDREAAGYGGSAGVNSQATGLVVQSDYFDNSSDGSITLQYSPVFPPTEVKFLKSSPTAARTHTLEVTVPYAGNLSAAEVQLSGTAVSQSNFKVSSQTKRSGESQTTFTFSIVQEGAKKITGNLLAIVRSVRSELQLIDQVGPEASLSIQPNTIGSAVHVYELRASDSIEKPTASMFTALGTATGCQIGFITGSQNLYLVSLEGCSTGTFGLQLDANSLSDELGNKGPTTAVVSELNDKSDPQISVDVQAGTLPKNFLSQPVTRVFGEIDTATQAALKAIGVYAPMDGAPTVSIVTDLGQALPEDVIAFQTSKEIAVGSSVDLGITVSPEIAQSFDAVAFIKTGDLWQFLGRSPFSGNSLSAESFGVAQAGTFNIRIVLVSKDVVTTMSMRSGFGKSLPVKAPQAVTEPETRLGNQQIDIVLNAVVGPEGAPAVVDQLQPPVVDPGAGILEFNLPSINLGEPVANSAIGATGDDFGPSQPFDPLGTPESVAHVVKTTAATVAVVSAVAAAASAAAGAAAGAAPSASGSTGGSAGGSASASSAGKQDTEQQDGEISNIDASVESFTSSHAGWGDRIVIFRLGIFTFLDKFTHDLTTTVARFSPVVSKIINDGAYLRALLGSLWLAFPIGGVMLAMTALGQPASELAPPVWQLFIAIAVLGLFDAFSGMLATLVYVVGVIGMFGLSSVSDIRLILGIIVMGFGPALIAVAFRQIRKHFETGFSYIWERLVDIAVLGFFTYWTVGSLVSTLPALAGKTLSAANHVNDFAVCLGLAVVVRIILEELTARSFAMRLDKINPTEVPETSQLQKVLSTLLRLAVFIFVTAAFMGNTWQVWVGSIIFILPNVLSWIEDRLPNSPLLWKIIPTGVPGLAFSLVVASYSSLYISQWIGDWPDFAQWSFMLLPIPMFLIGVIAMFGREGADDEDRPIKAPKWRYIYRLGGVVMLLLTASLAGII